MRRIQYPRRTEALETETLPRLNVRTAPEISRGVDLCLVDLHQRAWKYRGRKFSKEALVSTAVMHFLDLSAEEQDAILTRRTNQLEGALGIEFTPLPPAARPAEKSGEVWGAPRPAPKKQANNRRKAR